MLRNSTSSRPLNLQIRNVRKCTCFVHGCSKCIFISFHINHIPIIDIITTIFARTTFSVHTYRQFCIHIPRIRNRIILPFVATGHCSASHKRQYHIATSTATPRQYSDLFVIRINSPRLDIHRYPTNICVLYNICTGIIQGIAC